MLNTLRTQVVVIGARGVEGLLMAGRDTLIDQGAELRQSLGLPNEAAIEEVGQLPKDEPPTTGERDAASHDAHAWIR